jgi:hypothetical protein
MTAGGLRASTLALAAAIPVSAVFMRQFRDALARQFGENALIVALVAAFAACAAAVITRAARGGVHRALAALILCAGAIWLAAGQRFFSEKTHVLSYGLLGYLAHGDLARSGKREAAVWAALFAAGVGLADEAVQGFLPYRVADWKDVRANAISSAIGACLSVAARGRA